MITLAITFTNLINDTVNSVTNLILHLGYIGIFTAALAETLFPIIPSELIFPLAGYVVQSQNLGIGEAIMFGFVGSLGSTIGAIIIYFLSLKVGRRVILKIGKYILINENKLHKSEIWFQKYGKVAVLLGRLAPGIRELISVPAGLSRMNLIHFILFTFIGSFLWSLSLTMIGFYLGDAWDEFSQESSKAFHVISIIIIISIIAILVYKLIIKKRRNKKQKEK
ncbi:MAG: DedA family protein [Deltaproteobacteria bacterium]|jgi:membrane protein DedA with SNARE-associated domain|nr:DedA family protein [Nitrososphaeraceae archaeon]